MALSRAKPNTGLPKTGNETETLDEQCTWLE